MAFLNSFLRLTLKWQLPGGEVANSSLSWNPDDTLVSLDDATVDALALKGSNFWSGIRDQYHPNTLYVGSSVTWVGTDGHVLSRVDRPVTGSPGTNGGFPTPNEVAVCMSLRSATSTRRTRGRMYLPGLATPTLTTDGRWGTTSCADIASNGATLCSDVTVGLVGYTAVVASATGSTMAPVLAVAVGDVPDAQRRRRDRLVESYSVTAVP